MFVTSHFLDQRQRECAIPPQHAEAVAHLALEGILAHNHRNEEIIGFAHDVFLDYAIARHVLQPLHQRQQIVQWLRAGDVVRRSWALPSIVFEAERRYVQDRDSFWDVACDIVDTDVVVDWLSPARGAESEDLAGLFARFATDERAVEVFQRLGEKVRT